MTETAKHTPGPWSFSFESIDPEWAVVTTSGGHVLANVNADFRQEANANLIAAAPDMLAALELILSPSPHYGATQAHRDRIAEARAKGLAAIAKARGELAP